jgi:hypothetical protein
MLDAIAANERMLGRALAPARLIRIRLLRDGESFELRRFDGTGAVYRGFASDGPGWAVEAVGTFIYGDGQIDSLGTHGFTIWGDAGGEMISFFPCWSAAQPRPEEMEGECGPP